LNNQLRPDPGAELGTMLPAGREEHAQEHTTSTAGITAEGR
jgi:hypothetical protein